MLGRLWLSLQLLLGQQKQGCLQQHTDLYFLAAQHICSVISKGPSYWSILPSIFRSS